MENSIMPNIIEMIESHNITPQDIHQNKILIKIKSKFTEVEQQMFYSFYKFYSFLNYSDQENFIINLDDVWKWVGFSTKQHSKKLLDNNFKLDIDYKILKIISNEPKKTPRGGHNKETIMLNVRTFKLFCLKAGTKKSDEIHNYFINLEEVLIDVIQEECDELNIQLTQKGIELENHVITTEIDKIKIREKTIIEQFPTNTQCVYYGIIDNVSNTGEKLIKFGNSNSLKDRVKKHKKTYLNFQLINAFKVDNKFHIENALKQNELFSQRQRTITISDKKYIELLNINELDFDELDKTIKEIISDIEYSPKNYIKVLEEHKSLKKQIEEKNLLSKQLEETNKITNGEIRVLTAENTRLKTDIIRIIKKLKTTKKKN